MTGDHMIWHICTNTRAHIMETLRPHDRCPYAYYGYGTDILGDERCGEPCRRMTDAEIAAFKLGGAAALAAMLNLTAEDIA